MKKRLNKTRKKKILFAGIMSGLLLTCWTGLAILVLISVESPEGDRIVRNESPAVTAPDPASDPEGFSLYAERNGRDTLQNVNLSLPLEKILISEWSVSNADTPQMVRTVRHRPSR